MEKKGGKCILVQIQTVGDHNCLFNSHYMLANVSYQDTREPVISRRDSKMYGKKRGRPNPLTQPPEGSEGLSPCCSVAWLSAPGKDTFDYSHESFGKRSVLMVSALLPLPSFSLHCLGLIGGSQALVTRHERSSPHLNEQVVSM